MGKDPDREPPFFFTKWAETVVPSGTTIAYPPETGNFHYEAELVVAIAKGGRSVKAEAALDHVYGYATGLDMTRRRSEEHTSELQSLMRISYAVFCLKKNNAIEG